MSAQPAPEQPPIPEWFRPPPGGFTAEDLDRLPNLPPHTELIDGSLILVSPQATFHTLALNVLEEGLWRTVPKHLRIRPEMSVVLGLQQRPEPDLLVIDASVVTGVRQTSFTPDAVQLAVEVVSPDAVLRDRERTPQLYAQAGIAHFWRVEEVFGKPAVFTYELDPATHSYVATGRYLDQLKLDRPYNIDIDLTEFERRL